MDIVKDSKIDWLGLKWFFVGISLTLMAIGAISIVIRGVNLGVDFTGGTLVHVKFTEEPDLDRIRLTLGEAGLKAEEVIRFDEQIQNEVQVRIARGPADETLELTLGSNVVFEALLPGLSLDPGKLIVEIQKGEPRRQLPCSFSSLTDMEGIVWSYLSESPICNIIISVFTREKITAIKVESPKIGISRLRDVGQGDNVLPLKGQRSQNCREFCAKVIGPFRQKSPRVYKPHVGDARFRA